MVVADGGIQDESGAAIPEAAAQAVAGAAATGPGGAALGLVVRDDASLDREDRRGAAVRRVGGCRPVVEAAAEAVAAIAGCATVASLRPVVGQRAARDVDDAAKGIRNPAPEPVAAEAAECLVVRHRAAPEGDGAAAGNRDEGVAAVIPDPATEARAHEGAG